VKLIWGEPVPIPKDAFSLPRSVLQCVLTHAKVMLRGNVKHTLSFFPSLFNFDYGVSQTVVCFWFQIGPVVFLLLLAQQLGE